jgi:hypothetical protein
MTDLRIEFSSEELLSTHEFAEPLVAGGVRCHGGFQSDGSYVSPRTLFRGPALESWQDNHRATFGTEILHAPVETFPGNYPNVEQARFLLRSGVREPIISTLTRIGTVEGFGAMIRFLAPSDMQKFFVEEVTGTATAHLGRGLVEAHARDEAGFGEEAGHDRMWYAVRDVAFENPITQDETEEMLKRLGVPVGAGTDLEGAQQRFIGKRMHQDLDFGLEMLISTMLKVLFVEIKAFHVFAWAEDMLSDRDLVAGEGEAARLVSFIRADETPHVEYLRTSLTEMRDRTFIGESGKRYAGTEIIGSMWDASLAESLGILEEQNRATTVKEIERAVLQHRNGKDLLAEFHSLADPVPVAS